MRTWLLAMLPLSACFGSSETPFQEGLEPLEDMAISAPAAVGDGSLPETFELITGETDEHLWGHLRGYVHADLVDVWRAYQDADVVVDRRRVESWEPRLDVEEGYDFSMAIDQVVVDTITIEYTLTWRHGAAGGTEAEPEKVSMRWQKTAGTDLIKTLEGSVALLRTDEDGVTEIQSVEHLKAPLTSTDEIEGLLTDVYTDVVATVHGEPLPQYD